MNKFYKRVHAKLIEIDRRRPWLLEQTGIKSSTWSSWERHDRIPPADRALAIADALGVTVDFLVTGRESELDMRAASPVVTEILNRLTTMGADQLEQVRVAVNSIATLEE